MEIESVTWDARGWGLLWLQNHLLFSVQPAPAPALAHEPGTVTNTLIKLSRLYNNLLYSSLVLVLFYQGTRKCKTE